MGGRERKTYRSRKKNYTKEKHIMDIDTFYNIEYQRLLKEADFWNNSGQYWMGQESQRRATAILNENIDEYNIQNHSEKLFFKK
tara:strand:- start:406 stop:657 length:252 start_codon:yes stop_codon:yes gene_type:complete